MTHKNKPEWREILSFLQALEPVFINTFYETKTSPTFPGSISLKTLLRCLTFKGLQ